MNKSPPSSLPPPPQEDELIDGSLRFDEIGLGRNTNTPEANTSPSETFRDSDDYDSDEEFDPRDENIDPSTLDALDGNHGWMRIPNTLNSTVSYFQKFESGRSGWGKAVAIIDRKAVQVLAWLWCMNAYSHIIKYNGDVSKAEKKEGQSGTGRNRFRKVIVIPDSHSQYYGVSLAMPNPISDRIFLEWMAWRQEDDGSFLMAFTSAKSKSARIAPQLTHHRVIDELTRMIQDNDYASHCVLGSSKGFWRIKPVAKNVCEVTLVQQGNFGGMIPGWIMDRRVKDTLGQVTKIQIM